MLISWINFCRGIYQYVDINAHDIFQQPGGRLNLKMPSYQYRDSHVKDNTVSPTVLFLTWESPYLRKMVFILRALGIDL